MSDAKALVLVDVPALMIERFWSHTVIIPDVDNACWLWAGPLDRDGYGVISATTSTGRIHSRAHRLAYAIAHGAAPAGRLVCHRCDNPRCVRVEHLFLGTDADNVADMMAKGRCRPARGSDHGSHLHPEKVPRGERSGSAKLTSADVIDIRHLLRVGARKNVIARAFGVNWKTIDNIDRGLTWCHVTGRRAPKQGGTA